MAIDFGTTMAHVWSEGTMRPDDYAGTLIVVYSNLVNCGFAENNSAVNELKSLRYKSIKEEPGFSEENYRWMQEEVEELINDICAEHGYWFGGHPDDPACIGIWKSVEE